MGSLRSRPSCPNLAESLSDTMPSVRNTYCQRWRVGACRTRAPAGMLIGLPAAPSRHVETRERQIGSIVVLDVP